MHYTVCIPSHNRGSRALESVLWMRERIPAEVDILVINNGSDIDTEGYAALRIRPDVSVVDQPNKGFLGSFNACIASVKDGVAIMLSDEDVVPPEAFTALDQVDWSSVSVVRGSVGVRDGATASDAYTIEAAAVHTKGIDALCSYGFRNSYTSGTCYNLSKFSGVTELYERNCWKHKWYPHLYLDLLGCAVGDVAYITEATALEGKASDEGAKPSQYNTQYSLGSRIDQHIVLRDGLFDAMKVLGWDLDTFAQAYVALCRRTIGLVANVNRPQYAQARIDHAGAVTIALNVCIAAVMDFKHCAPAFGWIESQVRGIVGAPTQ